MTGDPTHPEQLDSEQLLYMYRQMRTIREFEEAAGRLAEQARRTLIDWPAGHYGYRQKDIREIVGLLDEAISDLQASLGQ